MRKPVALIIVLVVCFFTAAAILAAAVSADDGEDRLFGIYDPESKTISFSVTEPQEGEYAEITGTTTVKSFIQSHRDAELIDFALKDEDGKDKRIVLGSGEGKQLFYQMQSLKKIENLPNLDTSACTDMTGMFMYCENLVEADVSKLDTSNCTDMEFMFTACRKLKVIDVKNFDTSKVTSFSAMFQLCSAVEVLDVKNFSTASIGTGYPSNDGMTYMFRGCYKVKSIDLSNFDMSNFQAATAFMGTFLSCNALEKLTLGPKTKIDMGNSYDNGLRGNWTREGDTRIYTADELSTQYDGKTMSGTYIHSELEGHFYRTDGTLDANNLWEVHSPESPFKGYCINLNRKGVGTYLDRVEADDDSDILELLCTAEEGSSHGHEPIGSSLREALITLIYYGWPNDAAGIQTRYGLSNNDFMNLTQVAIWDFTDKYNNKAGETKYTGSMLDAYHELINQRFSNIPGTYKLYLYGTWEKTQQNLISIMGLTDQIYGGVEVQKTGTDGKPLKGAEFTIYDSDGNVVTTITSRSDGVASVCRTDSFMGLKAGTYSVKETKAPAGYELSDTVYIFSITENNQIVVMGTKQGGTGEQEVMLFEDEEDVSYEGGGVIVVKRSEKGTLLSGAEFTIYNTRDEEIMTIITDSAGVARTGVRDLPLGDYYIKETKAPAGYQLSNQKENFSLTENGKYYATDIQFSDKEKTGEFQLEVSKTLENDDLRAEQFRFELLDDNGRVIQTVTNDASGKVKFDKIPVDAEDLGYKNYQIREIDDDKDNIQYDRHILPVTVLIVDNGEDDLECNIIYGSEGTEFKNIANRRKFEVSFDKKILNKDISLEGAHLMILDAYGREIKSWVTKEEPETAHLYPGNYTLVEKKAPNGYDAAQAIPFTVGENGEITCEKEGALSGGVITMRDAHHNGVSLSLKKLGETEDALKGAVFTLTGTDDLGQNVFSTAATDENGVLHFSGLLSGDYILEETQAPPGYKKLNKKWNVRVDLLTTVSKTSNIDDFGEASGNYANNLNTSDTVTLTGADSIHVRIFSQTEAGYDYLMLKDAGGSVLSEDMNGKKIGDANSRITGGRAEDAIIQSDFDFEGDTVIFNFVSDEGAAAYGYYAEVTSSTVTVKDEDGHDVPFDDDGNIRFTNSKEKISIPVKKEWKDSDDNKGSRPAQIRVRLHVNGEDTGKTLDLNKSNEWKGSFTDLDTVIAGEKAVYTVTEEEVTGYKASVSGDMDSGFTITNELKTPEEPKTPDEPEPEKKEEKGSKEVPVIEKYVNDNKVSRLKHVTDSFWFKIIGKVPEGTKKYKITDDLPSELAFADAADVSIKVNDEALSDAQIKDILAIKGNKLTVEPTADMLEKWKGFTIVIEFKAKFRQPVSDEVKKDGVVNSVVASVDDKEYYSKGTSDARIYPLSGPDDSGSKKSGKHKKSARTAKRHAGSADTGDRENMILFVYAALASALCIAVAARWR